MGFSHARPGRRRSSARRRQRRQRRRDERGVMDTGPHQFPARTPAGTAADMPERRNRHRFLWMRLRLGNARFSSFATSTIISCAARSGPGALVRLGELTRAPGPPAAAARRGARRVDAAEVAAQLGGSACEAGAVCPLVPRRAVAVSWFWLCSSPRHCGWTRGGCCDESRVKIG
jgi:hypothetical protein